MRISGLALGGQSSRQAIPALPSYSSAKGLVSPYVFERLSLEIVKRLFGTSRHQGDKYQIENRQGSQGYKARQVKVRCARTKLLTIRCTRPRAGLDRSKSGSTYKVLGSAPRNGTRSPKEVPPSLAGGKRSQARDHPPRAGDYLTFPRIPM